MPLSDSPRGGRNAPSIAQGGSLSLMCVAITLLLVGLRFPEAAEDLYISFLTISAAAALLPPLVLALDAQASSDDTPLEEDQTSGGASNKCVEHGVEVLSIEPTGEQPILAVEGRGSWCWPFKAEDEKDEEGEEEVREVETRVEVPRRAQFSRHGDGRPRTLAMEGNPVFECHPTVQSPSNAAACIEEKVPLSPMSFNDEDNDIEDIDMCGLDELSEAMDQMARGVPVV